MAPSTAVTFVLLGLAALGLATPDELSPRRRVAEAAALLAAAACVVNLATGWAGGIDAIWVPRPEALGAVPTARMSPVTAGGLLLGSAGLLLIGHGRSRRLRSLAAIPAAGLAGLGSLVLLGYLYGTPLLYGGTVIPVALPTGAGMVALGLALLALAGPESLLLRPLVGPSTRARLLRAFLPVIPLLVVVDGHLHRIVSFPSPAVHAVVLSLVSAAVVAAAVTRIAHVLGAELDRSAAEVGRLNASLESRVAERTAQLEAANRELEAFSYSVSHDLRAPLRHIDGFVHLLERRAGAGLDAASLHYLRTIAASADRMARLIDALLSFSRMSRAELARQPVDLGSLARDVADRLCQGDPERPVVVSVEPIPAVAGDRELLRVVLANLLSNAFKYSRPAEPARIRVAGRLDGDGQVVVAVQDNGVGFDMRYADKLFGVFQRLHRAEDFEGTGIGLATVQRIVHRHGGRTWAEGEVGRGATFFFTLPAAAEGRPWTS
jgi:signal transduction histidine kinase